METQKPRFNPRVLDRIKFNNMIRTEKALAQLIGVNVSTMSRWRNGDSGPGWEATAKILKLGISPDEMILNSSEDENHVSYAA